MKIAKKIIAALVAMVATATTLQAQVNLASILGGQQQQQTLTPIGKVNYAQNIIDRFYIDNVDSDSLAEAAIIGMLKTLDPHSQYSNPEETSELTTPLEGNFSGIGIQFNMLNDTLYVIQTTAGGPSEKVGIQPGDRILRADDIVISGAKKKNSDIIKTLRGPKGTVVNIEVIRKGVNEPIWFRIVRDDIPLNSVDAAFMADATTGFIRITRFAETTDEEFAEALKNLRRQGMKNLIIDLEDNGGGYLGSAVSVASHLLRNGDLVTYTESSKLERSDFNARRGGDFTEGRVVVLVNQYSASASEILSGAIQDHDRGLIVGRRTFGKGLVQRPFPFPDGSMIRLTVSRYHTPSGRVIQKPYELGDDESYRMDMAHRYENGEFSSADNIEFPDSLRYYTLRNHRAVYGGGGIMPDMFVPVDTTAYSHYYRDLVAQGLINSFSISFVDENRESLKTQYPDAESFIEGFEVGPDLLATFTTFSAERGVEVDEDGLERSAEAINTILKGIIGRSLYFDHDIYYRIAYPKLNPVYSAGLQLINDEELYNRLLTTSRQ